MQVGANNPELDIKLNSSEDELKVKKKKILKHLKIPRRILGRSWKRKSGLGGRPRPTLVCLARWLKYYN